MENKHMKRCSTLYVIRETQIKTTARYFYTEFEWPESGALTPDAGEAVEQQELSVTDGGKAERSSRRARLRGSFLQN